MRPARKVAAALVVAAAALSISVPSRASCAAPTVNLSAAAGYRGDQIIASGRGWVSGCDDTGGGGIGCSGYVEDPPEPSHPEQNITIWFVGPVNDVVERDRSAAEFSVVVGHADADDHGRWDVRLTVPELKGGTYYVISNHGSVAQFQIY
jgi:hypothetical protein